MKRIAIFMLAIATMSVINLQAQSYQFNGLGMNLGNLAALSNAKSRSISPENFTGEPGKGGMATPSMPNERNVNNASWAARDYGQGWKVNPFITINANETVTLAEIDGPGAIQHIWMTPTGNWRFSVIRFYWDGEKEPSIEVPVADFFCMGWGVYAPVNSLPVCVNPGSAFNCYWMMPFRKHCRITMENINDKEPMNLYYQVNYTLTDVPEDMGYLHAQFRRTRWNETSDFTVIDGVKGKGQFVGVYMAWGVHNVGWWGEGEMKFFIDDDKKFPTICTTGLEDYFCGSYNFDRNGKYTEFCTPYAGLCQVIRPDGTYQSQQRFGLYRWHIQDPVRFDKAFKATIQDLGWRHDGRYLKQNSDISATTFWYQTEPHAKFPQFPSWTELETL